MRDSLDEGKESLSDGKWLAVENRRTFEQCYLIGAGFDKRRDSAQALHTMNLEQATLSDAE